MEMVKWEMNSSFLEKENQVAMIKGEAFIKVNKEYFDIIDTIVKNMLDISTLESYFVDKNDYEKIMEIIDSLKKIGVLIDYNYTQDDSDQCIKFNSISLIITNRCNLSCVHCSQSAEKVDYIKGELSFEEMCKVIDFITKYEVNEITITGGEPLIRNDFLDIAKYIRSKYKGNLVLLTNGLLISEKNVNEITSLFNYISISIDGIDEELTSKIRGKGVFQKVVETIELLQAYHYDNIELSAILPNSIEIEEKFSELCKKLSVRAVNRSLIYSGRAYNNSSFIDKIFKEYIEKYGYTFYDNIENLGVGTLETCGACDGTLSIDPKGDVFPCNLLQETSYRIGNILKKTSLLDEYRNTNASKTIEKMKEMDVEPCKECEIKKICWFCLADFKEFKLHKSLFEDYCRKRKQSIYKYYFKE